MKKIILPLLALTIILTGCSTLRVITDQAKDVDMSKYKTFGFAPLEKSKAAPVYFSELNQKRIQNTIAKELSSKGYTTAEKPDLMISIYLKVQDKQSIVSSYPYAGRGDFIGIYGGYRYEPASTHIIDYTEGTLIIDLVDTAKNTLVWQGVAIDTVQQNSKHAERNINTAIAKVFENFPAKNMAK